jgi:hypothetical protein
MEEVVAFTWRDAYLDENAKYTNQNTVYHGNGEVFSAATHLNAVRLKNGDVIPMPIIAKPVIPERTMVTLKKVYA